MNFKALLLDIEGTTSSISFVHEVLFPYAKKELKNFIENNYQNAVVQASIDSALEEEGLDKDERITKSIALFSKWIDEDKKIKALKDLQGLIWEDGYKKKDFFGHIYEDAYQAIQNWSKKYKVYIYSSGSIKAQKLIFAHTEYGDLNNFFSGNFDTGIGNKKASESYEKIAFELKLNAQEILFLSDNSEELKAAQKAGFQVIKVARPADKIDSDPEFHNIKSFQELNF